MMKVWQAINGAKTYIVCSIGIAAIAISHFFGPIPGVQINDADWLNQIWTLVLVMTARNAVGNIGK